MIIDLNGRATQTHYSERLDADQRPFAGQNFLASSAHPEIVPAPAEKAGQRASKYPSELTLSPTYIEHLPAKRPKGAASPVIRERLNLTVVASTKSPDPEHAATRKIIQVDLRNLDLEVLPKAA